MQVVWGNNTNTNKPGSTPRITQAPKGIVTMRIRIAGDNMNTQQADFAVASNTGSINNVPAGTNRTVTLHGLDGSNTVLYQGQVNGVEIIANQNNDAGAIVVTAIADADNDGVADSVDDFPNDINEHTDTDLDGTGNNADTDDDNDGLPDTDEATFTTNPLIADTDEDGFNDGQETGLGMNPLVDDAALPNIIRINTSIAGVSNGCSSSETSLSEDGQLIVFHCTDGYLVNGDTNAVSDVFVKNINTGGIERLSVHTDGTQANAAASAPSMDASGQLVVFTSAANNLVSGDTNSASDIFLRDLQNQTTTRVNTASYAAQGDGDSSGGVISDDGTRFIFTSSATNFASSGDTNGVADIYMKTFASSSITRVSIHSNGTTQPTYSCSSPYISNTGTAVFNSYSDNLVANDTNLNTDVFLRSGSTTSIASVDSNEVLSNSLSTPDAFTPDGRYILIWSGATNLVAGDTNGTTDLFLRDTVNTTTQRVTTATDGSQANGASTYGDISNDGRYVVFSSLATNLVADDTNGVKDVFIKDLTTGETRLISRAADGTIGNALSERPNISGDGNYVTFSSSASNLVPNDSNGAVDFFRVYVGP